MNSPEFYRCNGLEFCRFPVMAKKFPLHFHDHFVIGCLLSGARATICGHVRFVLKPFELLVIPPGLPHACQPHENCASEWVCAHIAKNDMLSVLRKFHCHASPLQAACQIVADKKLCLSLTALAESSRSVRRQNMEAELMRLVASVLLRSGICAHPAEKTTEEVEMAFCIAETPGECMSLEDMAEKANMDKFRFLRLFRRKKGITPWAYLENLRVNRARVMLAAGASISDAALSTGFCDQSHFNRRFKAYTGLTPGVYQKICEKAHPADEHHAEA